MATHDYIISNASGAAVRSDLNNALAAIVSNNSSATEPATTYAYMWWADTTSGQLKLRNAANDDWVVLLELDGTTLMEDGTVSAPGLAFADDTNTGFYRPAADSLGIATNGTNAIYIDSSQQVGIGTTSPDLPLTVKSTSAGGTGGALRLVNASATVGTKASLIFTTTTNETFNSARIDGERDATGTNIVFSSTEQERARIDSSGNVGIGTSSPAYSLDLGDGSSNPAVANYLRINTAGDYNFALQRQSNASFSIRNDGTGAVYLNTQNSIPLVFGVSSGTSSGSITEHARIDSSGRLLVGTSSASSDFTRAVFQGYNTATTDVGVICLQRGSNAAGSGENLGFLDFQDNRPGKGARIAGVADGSWSGSSYPTRLEFSTTASGASSPTERMRIDSAGSVVLANTSAFVAGYIYNTTTATGANVNVDASGFLRRSTSSIKYKTNVETIQDQYADAILGCRPVWYQSTCEADKPEWGYWGFIAEEVAEIDPRLCFFKEEEDGALEPEGVQYDRFVPHLLNLIKRQQQAIETLEAKVAALESA